MNIEIIIFIVVLFVLLAKVYAKGAIPTMLKAVKSGGGDTETKPKEEKKKETRIQRFRESAGIPLSYILLFGILFHVSWVKPYLTYNWMLTAMLIIVMISIDMTTGVIAKSWKESVQRKKARFHLNAGLILLLVYIVVSVNGWSWSESFGQREPVGVGGNAGVATNNWQLCWDKVPGYKGETATRGKCLKAKIETRNDDLIIISYVSSSGKGVQKGTSSDGSSYSGEWKDPTGWGRWHLKFISSETAFGWSDDKGSGYKQPNVLERRI